MNLPSTNWKAFRRHRAFTLVELLVAIVILAVLAALTVSAFSAAFDTAKQTREVSAAKQLITAYHAYAADNGGRLMPGSSTETIEFSDGTAIGGSFAKRYPFRIKETLQGNYAGSVVTNERLDKYNEGGSFAEYYLSVWPTFGLNTTFVGGNHDKFFSEPQVGIDEATYGAFAVTRMNQAVAPNKLIVFASATSIDRGELTYGNFYIHAPNSASVTWERVYDESKNPRTFGHVHPRYNERAVVAHLDGSVDVLDFEQLLDMTRWSNQAARAGDPDWTLTAK
ncbi:MAG: type II secretion system protein [Verrucomicrobiota bacterium]